MHCSPSRPSPAVLRATLWNERLSEARRHPSDILEGERPLAHPHSACQCAACAAVYVLDFERAPHVYRRQAE